MGGLNHHNFGEIRLFGIKIARELILITASQESRNNGTAGKATESGFGEGAGKAIGERGTGKEDPGEGREVTHRADPERRAEVAPNPT